jgi:hypothetical protein
VSLVSKSLREQPLPGRLPALIGGPRSSPRRPAVPPRNVLGSPRTPSGVSRLPAARDPPWTQASRPVSGLQPERRLGRGPAQLRRRRLVKTAGRQPTFIHTLLICVSRRATHPPACGRDRRASHRRMARAGRPPVSGTRSSRARLSALGRTATRTRNGPTSRPGRIVRFYVRSSQSVLGNERDLAIFPFYAGSGSRAGRADTVLI